MKNFKMLLLIGAISAGSFAYCTPSVGPFSNMASISEEIEAIIEESNYIFGEDLEVTIFFSVSPDNRIQHLSVASENADLNQFIALELENKTLMGQGWKQGVIYELTVDYSEVLVAAL